jgi:hypothetical protein
MIVTIQYQMRYIEQINNTYYPVYEGVETIIEVALPRIDDDGDIILYAYKRTMFICYFTMQHESCQQHYLRSETLKLSANGGE